MTLKDVIAQAEMEFRNTLWQENWTYETGKKYLDFIFSTYTKDLLQSVESAIEEKKVEEIEDSGETRVEASMYGFNKGFNTGLHSATEIIRKAKLK